MLKHRFKFNLKFKIIGEAVSRFSALIFYALAGRLLGAREFGLFSLAFSYASIFMIFSELGTNTIITRNLAQNKSTQGEIASTTTLFKFLLMPLTLLILHLVISHLYPGERIIFITDLMGLVALLTSIGDHQSAILTGVERVDIEAQLKALWKGGALGLAVLFFMFFHSLEAFIGGMIVGQGIGVVIGFIWIFKNLKPKIKMFQFPLLKEILIMSLPLFLGYIFLTLYYNQANLILSFLGFGDKDIGWFAASNKLIDALKALPVLLASALFPIFSEQSIKDPPKFAKIGVRAIHFFLLIPFPFLIVGSLLSHEICRIIYGPDFGPTGLIFSIALWSFLGIFVNHMMLHLLLAAGRQKPYLWGSIFLAGTNTLLILILAPRMDVQGAAWALLGSEMLILPLFAGVVGKLPNFKENHFIPGVYKRLGILSLSLILFVGLKMILISFLAGLLAISFYFGIAMKRNWLEFQMIKDLLAARKIEKTTPLPTSNNN